MADILEKVVNEQDFFKKILAKIPGFDGYVDRTNRRAADKLLRETIADHFELLWQEISSIQRELISNGRLERVQDVETAALKIRQFIDRLRTAAYGYAGFFDAIKIGSKALADIYQSDLKLLDLESEIEQAIANLVSSLGKDDEMEAIRHLISISQRCLDTYEKRKEAVMNSSEESSTITPSGVS